jgi:hypothetical protein
VRPLLVVFSAEVVEPNLLRGEVALRWSCRLVLERPMHSFVTAVLLRVRRLDQLRVNAQANPPDGKAGEATEGGGGEWHPVIGSNGAWKAVLVEQTEKHRPTQL